MSAQDGECGQGQPGKHSIAWVRGSLRLMDLRGLVMDYGGVIANSGDGGSGVEDPLVAFVRRLRRAGIRTALLSNADSVLHHSAWEELFDAIVLAGAVGVAKPEPQSYLAAVDRIGLAPSQCVFVDDLRRNVSGAVAVGMVGVHHSSAWDTVKELEILFESVSPD
jgi:putative hydrolase of the HAD superfamily